jgi:hypothetical protein
MTAEEFFTCHEILSKLADIDFINVLLALAECSKTIGEAVDVHVTPRRYLAYVQENHFRLQHQSISARETVRLYWSFNIVLERVQVLNPSPFDNLQQVKFDYFLLHLQPLFRVFGGWRYGKYENGLIRSKPTGRTFTRCRINSPHPKLSCPHHMRGVFQMLFSVPFDFILPEPVTTNFYVSTNISLGHAVDKGLQAGDILQIIEQLSDNDSVLDSYLKGPYSDLVKRLIKLYAWIAKGVNGLQIIWTSWRIQSGPEIVDELYPTNCRDQFPPLSIIMGMFNSARNHVYDSTWPSDISRKVVSDETRIWSAKKILQATAQYICRAYLPNTSLGSPTMEYFASLVLTKEHYNVEWTPAELGQWFALMLTTFGDKNPTLPLWESKFCSSRERLLWIFLGARGWSPWCRQWNLETDLSCRLAFGKRSCREMDYLKGVVATLDGTDRVWLIEQLVRRAREHGGCAFLGCTIMEYLLVDASMNDGVVGWTALLKEVRDSPMRATFEAAIAAALKRYYTSFGNSLRTRVRFPFTDELDIKGQWETLRTVGTDLDLGWKTWLSVKDPVWKVNYAGDSNWIIQYLEDISNGSDMTAEDLSRIED